MIEYKNYNHPVPVRKNPDPEAPLINIIPKDSILYVLSEDSGWLRLHNNGYVFKTDDIKLINDFTKNPFKSSNNNTKLMNANNTANVPPTIPNIMPIPGWNTGNASTSGTIITADDVPRAKVDANNSSKEQTKESEYDKRQRIEQEKESLEKINSDIVGKQWRVLEGARQYEVDENGNIKRDANGNMIAITYPSTGNLAKPGNGSVILGISREGLIKVMDVDGKIVYLDAGEGKYFNGTEDDDYESIELTEQMFENREEGQVDAIAKSIQSNSFLDMFNFVYSLNTINLKSIHSIFGYPYQFLPIADPRVDISDPPENFDANTVNKMMDISKIGRKFMQRIVSRAPVLIMIPGVPEFLKGFSDRAKASLITKLGGGEDSELEQFINGNSGQYYTFKETSMAYYDAVNHACRALSVLLGIGDIQIPGVFGDDGTDTKIKDINWMMHAQHNVGYFAGAVMFYIHAEPQVHETFQNTVRPSALSQMTNQLSDKAMEVQFVLGGVGAAINGSTGFFGESGIEANFGSSFMDFGSEWHNGVGMAQSLVKNISTFLAGGKLIFPDIWADSTFARSYNITIKLISPDSDKISIFFNILVPLVHILGLVLPRSAGNNAYVSPFMVRSWYKSMFNIELGIIENCEITKGDKGGWSITGLPRTVTVNLSIKDLYHNMSQSIENGLNTLCTNPAQLNYLANLAGVNIGSSNIGQMIALWMALKTGNVTDFVDKLGVSLQRTVYGWFNRILPITVK